MHAPPRERLFVLLVIVELVVGFLLASDDERWMTTSLCLLLGATLLSLIAHFVDRDSLEQTAALTWFLAIVVSLRWFTLPAVFVPLMLVTIVGLPIVIRHEVLKRRAAVREARTQCAVCGYDLRASAERCPECGTPIHGEVERLRRIAAKMRAGRAGQPIDDDLRPQPSPPAADASDGRR